MIIAKDFTPKDIVAVKYFPVELKKYSFYRHLINIEDITPAKVVKPSKVLETGDEEGDRTEVYTIDKLLAKASPQLRELFLSLRKRILELGDDVWEKVGATYCDYRKSSTFVSPNVQPKKNSLLVYIKMGDKEIDDPRHWTVKGDLSYGKLNTKFKLSSLDQIEYAMHLVKQAYEYVP